MSLEPPIEVTTVAKKLIDGLTPDSTYLAQNNGGEAVLYTSYPTDPTDEDLSWYICYAGKWFEFDTDAADPTWVKVIGFGSELAVGVKD